MDDISLMLTASLNELQSQTKIQQGLDRISRQLKFQVDIDIDKSNSIDRQISSLENKIAKLDISGNGLFKEKDVKQIASYNKKLNEMKGLNEQLKVLQEKSASLQEKIQKNTDDGKSVKGYQNKLEAVNKQITTINDALGDTSNKFANISKGLENISTRVASYKNSLSTETNYKGIMSSFTSAQGTISNLGISDNSQIKSAVSDIEKLNVAYKAGTVSANELKVAVSNLWDVINTQAKVGTYEAKLDAFKTKNEQLIATSSELKTAVAQTEATINKFGAGQAEVSQVNNSFTSLNATLSTTKKQMFALSFADKITSAISRFAAFTIASKALMSLVSGLKEAISYVTELDSVMSEFRYVTGMSKDQVDDLRSSFSSLGEEIGATTEEVANAALEYVRQGKSISESMDLATESIKLSKLASIDSADATEYLTSAVNGYRKSGISASSVVDKLVSVDNVAATSSEELAEAMSKTATSAELSGVSMDKLLGYIGTVSEVTRGSAESIGNSFKTLFARIEKVTNDSLGSLDSINDTEEALNNVGIALREDDDSFRDTGDVLDDLGEKWDSLTEVQQQNIAYDIAGVRQKENFIVLMENYQRSLELTEVSLNSAGLATARYNAYQESVTGKQKSMQAAAEKLIDTFINSKAIGYFYDLLKGILNVLDGFQELTGGMGVWLVTGTVVLKLFNKLGKLDGIKNGIISLAQAFLTLTGAGSGATAVTLTFSSALSTLLPVVAAVVAVGVSLYAIWDATTTTLAERQQTIDDLTQSISDLQSEYSSLSTEENRTSAQDARLEFLKAEIDLEKESLQLEQQKKYEQESKETPYTTGKAVANATTVGSGTSKTTLTNSMDVFDTKMSQYKELEGKTDLTQDEINKAEKLRSALVSTASSWDDYIAKIEDYEEAGVDVNDIDEETVKALKEKIVSLGQVAEATEEATDATDDYAQENADLGLDENATASDRFSAYLNLASDAASEATSSVSDLQSTITDLSSVMVEMSDSGQLSIDTLIDLMTNNSELIGFLQEENGVYSMSEESMKAYFEYKKQATLADMEIQIDAAAAAVQSAEQAIDANAISASATVQAAGVEAESANSIVSSYTARATAAMVAAQAESIANASNIATSTFNSSKATDEQKAQVTELKLKLSGLINSYKVLSNVSYPDVISATNASTSATKANTEATNEAKEAAEEYLDTLQDEQDKMDAIAKAIEKIIEKEIDQLQDKKDASDDYYDAEIDKLQDKLDLLEDEYDQEDKLLELEKAKQALEEAQNAKNTRLYTADKGWTWVADASAVASAQEDLDDLQKEWDRDQEKKQIQSVIDKLKAEKKAVDDTIEAEIDKLQDLKDAWSEATDTTMTDLNKWEGALDYVKTFESANYSERISIMQDFTTKYQALANQIIAAQKAADLASSSSSSSGSSSSGGSSSGGSTHYTQSKYKVYTGYGSWEYYDYHQQRRGYYQYWSDGSKTILSWQYRTTSQTSSKSTQTSGGRKLAYATGGVDTQGGEAILHGTPNQAEVIFNAAQGKALYNFVDNLSKGRVSDKSVANAGTSINIQKIEVSAPNNATIDTILTTARQKIKTQQ